MGRGAVSLCTGKRLAEWQRIIFIAFRELPKSMFPAGSCGGSQGPDHLTFDLADSSKMSLSFYGKRPGPGMRLDKLSLQFAMRDTGLIGDMHEACERLYMPGSWGPKALHQLIGPHALRLPFERAWRDPNSVRN